MSNLLCSKSAGRDGAFAVAASIAISSRRDAISKIGTGNGSFNAFCAAGAVALSGTCGHIERPRLGRVQLGSLFARAGKTVGIPKTAGLNLVNCCVGAGLLRTAAFVELSRMHELWTCSPCCELQLRGGEVIDYYFRRLDGLWQFSFYVSGHHELRFFEYGKLYGGKQTLLPFGKELGPLRIQAPRRQRGPLCSPILAQPPQFGAKGGANDEE